MMWHNWYMYNILLHIYLNWPFWKKTAYELPDHAHWNICIILRGGLLDSNGPLNSLRPRPNRRHFADDIFKCIFENENEWISIKISLKFVPKGPIYNNPALVQIMAWRRPGDKPLSEPMMVSLLTHICVTRPQWVNSLAPEKCDCIDELVIFKLILGIHILSIPMKLPSDECYKTSLMISGYCLR